MVAQPPSFDSRLKEIAIADRGDGWLCACDEQGRYLLPCRELVTALASLLQTLGEPVLEVSSGNGELAEWLRAEDVLVLVTDADPPGGSCVERASAEEALVKYKPAVVLGSFVPVDSGVDRQVMAFATVEYYVVLGARINGSLGSADLWNNPAWSAERLEEIDHWMLTRHDVWLGQPDQPILRHGEAWLLRRKSQGPNPKIQGPN